ncbi:hypothetical protein OIT44_01330 [Weissella ceti]|uniref:Uncharacterized protein n=1 Tax=Weissella ceti TaxID=759620 RepID=A0ABT3E303_9LACO|nr:hypothetical protein [Weissella ceti]MCW0952720.1 hypothetical protein [Weissella ceti]QVK12422.1 hypothetical protein KHQ31_01970 [Weissella ceti]
MIKLVYFLSSMLTVFILVSVALFGNQHGWPPVMFMSMMFITVVGMTVLMTLTTIILQRRKKECDDYDVEN